MSSKDKKEIDPEVLLKRKFRAKCLFRALGRLVMANTYWMIEGIDHYEGHDVQKRVEQALRGKPKKKQLLTFSDKGLLNKPLADRTDQEKKYLYRIIGGLKCFKRYPNHVKRKLAAVTYFQYYSPNRVVVRENQEAHALYFIVSGEVTVSQMVYDELLGEHVRQVIGHMHAGEMFGEVSLLHNIPRTATVTTDDHSEFLQLMKENFKHVLQASLQAQWDDMFRAMSAFTYFDGLDEVSLREGCIQARTRSFDINDTILGDGQGIANHVYFVLSGQCQMIESMKIFVTKRPDKEFYTLFDPWEPEEASEEDLEKKYDNICRNSKDYVTSLEDQPLSKRAFITSLGSILKLPSIHGMDPRMDVSNYKRRSKKFSVAHFDESVPVESDSSIKVLEPEKTVAHDEEHGSNTRIASEEKLPVSKKASDEKHQDERRASEDKSHKPKKPSVDLRFSQDESNVILLPDQDLEKRHSIRYKVPNRHPRELRTYFMQVCRFNPGSTFGLGENMRDRRIIAVTPVTCMLMPKIWLLQHNTANIWTRIQHYLDKKIPKKEDLFKQWKLQREWQKYRDMVVEDVVANTHAVNFTSIHDVPYSIRMEELLDL